MSHKDHVPDLGVASGIATLDGSTLVIQNPANAQTTPAASKIPLSGVGSKIDKGWMPDFIASGASHAPGAVPDPPALAGTTKFLREDATWVVPGTTVSLPTGKMIWVDSVNGVDGTGTRGQEDKPFLTISAALAATGITSGDVVYVRPGVYSLNTTQLVVPAGVSLVGVDRRRCQLTYSGAATVTLVTLGVGSAMSFFDILPTPSAGTTTCVAISEVTANCFRVGVNAALSGNVIGLSVTATTLIATGAMTARECVFLGNGSGNSGLVVNGSGGTTRYTSTNFENLSGGGVGVTVTLGSARFERCSLNGASTGISIANSASASASADASTVIANYSVGANNGTLFTELATGPISLGAQVSLTGVITPTALAANANDYNPAGLANAHTLRLSASSAVNITGLAGGFFTGFAIAPTTGRQITLINIGTNVITLVNESSASTNTMRFTFIGGADVTLVAGAIVSLTYDATSARWRTQGGAGASGPGGLIQTQWVEVTTNKATSTSTWPSLTPTTINGATTLPQGTITVASTTGFPASGSIVVYTTRDGPQTVAYTGVTATTFTGCTGGTGAAAVGNLVYPLGSIQRTTVSSGATLPQATINVVSTTGFAASGQFAVYTSQGTVIVTYTGVTATTFTGCTVADPAGSTGVMSVGATVNSSSLQDLLTVNLTTSGGALIIEFFASVTAASNKTSTFRILVDGVVKRGSRTISNGSSSPTSTSVSLKLSGVTVGAHTVVVQWAATATSTINPTASEVENASLLVQEVSS